MLVLSQFILIWVVPQKDLEYIKAEETQDG